MTQALLAKLAAACHEFSDIYDPESAEDEDFMAAWRETYDAFDLMKAACPNCQTEDPGNPPPP